MSSGFGQLPSFANLSAADFTDLLQRLQQAPQDPRDTGPQPNTQGQPPQISGLGVGDLAPGDQGGPPLALNENDVRRLERQQADPQDLAALGGSPVDRLLFDRAGMGGGPNGFTGTADPLGSRNVPLPPARPSDDALSVQPATTGTVSGTNPDASAAPQRRVVASTSYHPDLASNNPTGGRPAAAGDYRGGPGDFDPLTGRLLGGSQQVGPSQGGTTAGVPAAQGAGTPSAPQQSILERFAQGLNHPDVSNLLLSIGTGLLTNRGIPEGIGAGLQAYQQSRLGGVKQALEQFKLSQEIQGQQATYDHLTKNLKLDPTTAWAAMLNSTLLTNVLSQQTRAPNTVDLGGVRYLVPPGAANDQSQWQRVGTVNGPQPGFEADPTNPTGQRPIAGGSADPNYKAQVAGAEAKAKDEAVGDKLMNVRPDGVVFDPNTRQPVYTAPGNKPQGFETEEKLRGDFNKQIGTFTQVHEGYGRVIAATRQRETNPSQVSPASDMSLVFGYMKMLDPGSVVREGEYATAKNAAGVPEQVLNAYNKARNGEFLSDRQRQDFLGQAQELYGTARHTAEGLADRYRGLAQQYGVSPDRSVYLPEMPNPPRLGQGSQTSGGAAGRFQELMNSGMSKADAFAQMRKEGL
jgi:hypothetical protein